MKYAWRPLLKVSRLFVIVLILNACNSTKINIEGPEKISVATKYERKLSTVNIPLSLPVKQLEAAANRELPITLYKDDNPDDDHFAITVTRTGPLIINGENDQLIYSVPIHVYAIAKYELDVCNICPKIGKSESTQFDIKVRSKTQLGLQSNWQVSSHTSSEFEWGSKPYIDLGPISIPISKILEPILKKQIENISTILDREIQKRVEIKSKVQKAWLDVQQPILLDKSRDAWLKISPREIRASSIGCSNDEIRLKIGLRSFVETFTGGKPSTEISTTLPGLIIDNNLGEDFQVLLSGEIPYEYASKLIKNELAGKFYEFENGKYHINILDAELFGSPDKVTLRLAIEGKARLGLFPKNIKGNIFLQGAPFYEVNSGSIKIRDFDFHFKTRDLLLKTAGWITRVGFKQKIQESIQVPIKEKLEEARKMIQEGLNANGRINNYILLKGNIVNIVPEGIYLSPSSMKAVVTGTGNISLLIDKL